MTVSVGLLTPVGTREAQEELTLELDNLDGVVLLAYTEDLEIAEDRLLSFRMAVDLDA